MLRLAPAESPPSTNRSGSRLNAGLSLRGKSCFSHFKTDNVSSIATGNFCSGDKEYSTPTTAHPERNASSRMMRSCVSLLPTTNPPPCKYTSAGKVFSGSG